MKNLLCLAFIGFLKKLTRYQQKLAVTIKTKKLQNIQVTKIRKSVKTDININLNCPIFCLLALTTCHSLSPY